MEYKITYSNRKTIGIYIHNDASVEVRCPKRTSKKTIHEIVLKKKNWIEKTKQKVLSENREDFNEDEKIKFIEMSKKIIPEKVEYFSKIMGVKPTSVRIGNAKSYWGCCSGKNRIAFSWRLMQASNDVIDYVVVHELAHIKEHNHSKAFWEEVKKVIPDYKSCIAELKKLG